ncbi:MAG: DUF58 domain-containing protein [Thermoplasmata archaeon]|nr:DUF58 domain-containing protein [Thermoplasmata archaeon]
MGSGPVISRRGWAALAASGGALLLAVYSLNILLLAGAIACFAAVAGEMLAFQLFPPGPERYPFATERVGAPRAASPGAQFSVSVEVRYNGASPVVGEVRDLLPRSLLPISGRSFARRTWEPGESARLEYAVRTTTRGSHLLGPTTVTVDSPHGLAWRQWSLPTTDQPVRVVPPAPLERAHQIGPALLTRMQGRLALRHRGFGTEFRSLRPYQLSDDIRHVAWKRSRPGQMYVREFEQESRQDFVLLLDVTPAMAAGLPGENALDRAVEASALVIAAVSRSGEDRVGLLIQGGRTRQYLRPERGESHFRRLSENLAYLRPTEGTFDIANALELCTRRLVRNTHVLVFTALDGPLEPLHLAFTRFRARGHRVYVFPANRARMYPAIEKSHPASTAFGWAGREERANLERKISQVRGEGIPVFPYDRRGASTQVLSTYTQLRAWGTA